MSGTNNGGKRRASEPDKHGAGAGSAASGSPWPERIKKAAVWGISGLLGLALLGVIAFVVLYKAIDIPEPNNEFLTQTTQVYYQDGKTSLGTFSQQNRTSLPLDEMPQSLKDAVVAAENRTFWTDNGIDPKGILRAAFSNATSDSTQGASTITQQYVKVLYLTQERSYTRKAKEAILSLKIHNQLSKEEILEGYLNTIYFGRGAYGVEAAAHAYFGISARDLNLKQSAVLAAVLNNPYGYDPRNGKEAKHALKARYQYALNGMASMGTISAQKAEKAAKWLPKFPKVAADNRLGGQKGHALTLVKQELLALKDEHGNPLFTEQQIDGEGLHITTTLSKKAMNAAEQGVAEARPDGFKDGAKGLHVASASVQPGTGALKGFYGGQDYLKSQINWAKTGGSVGSTMKPVTAATALKAGFSLKDTFDGNSPYTYPDGTTVHNEGESMGIPDGMDYGRVDMIKAMEESINTAFIDMTVSIPDGSRKIWETGLKMGLTPEKANPKYPGIPDTSPGFDPHDPRITLGRATISPINLANAYATIAAGGEHNDVYIIKSVKDRHGTLLYKHKDAPSRAIPEDIADDVSYTLQQTADHGTGESNASSSDLGRPAAGKTGTATAEGPGDKEYVSSAWYSGYTPQLATSVMYVRGDGNDSLEGWLPTFFGSEYPATTWTAIMSRALDGAPVESFPPPAWVDGEAPGSGHAPAPPPAPEPKPTPKPKPKPKPSPTKKSPSPKPSPTTHSPSPTPTTQSPTPLPSTSSPGVEPPPPGQDCPTTDPDYPNCKPGNGRGNGNPRAVPAWALRPEPTAVTNYRAVLRTAMLRSFF